MKTNLTNFSLTALGKVQQCTTVASFGYVLWMLVLLLGGGAFEVKAMALPAPPLCATVTEIPVAECQDLLILYNSTNGPNWTNKTGWNVTNTPCSWYGVSCGGGHVTQLSLSANQLSGPIPNFSNLPQLATLSLDQNQLSGPIPDFSNLPKLTVLSLYGNQLVGTVPNLNWSSFDELRFIWNCGLVAYDATQETILNGKDPHWKYQNPSCPVLTINKTGNGVVTSSPAGINCGTDCTENYAPNTNNTNVQLTATADAGYRLDQWSGDCTGAETTISVKMDAPKSCTASFVATSSDLTVGGTVWIDMNANGIKDPGDANETAKIGIGIKFKNLSNNEEFSTSVDHIRDGDGIYFYNGEWLFYSSLPTGDYKVETQLPSGWVQLVPAPDSIVHIDGSNTKIDIGVQPPFTIGFSTDGSIAINDVTPNEYCRHPMYHFSLSGSGTESILSYRISSRTLAEVFSFTAQGFQGTAKILADGTPSITISPTDPGYAHLNPTNEVRNISLNGNVISFDIPFIFSEAASGEYDANVGIDFNVSNEGGYNASISSCGQVPPDTIETQAEAGPDMTVNMGETVQFQGTVSPPNKYYISWYFEDTGEWVNQTLTPTHVFTTPGTYKVSLYADNYNDFYSLDDDLTVTVLWVFSPSGVVEIPQAETEALVALYKGTDGDNWRNNTGWLKTSTPCSWYGVGCSGGHVTELQLAGNQLNGTISDFGNLPKLWLLDLANNQLSGPIPDFSNLPNVGWLSLSSNQLSGPVPDFSNLPDLTALDLDNNQLSGPIPNFSNLPNLTELWLRNNQLSGSIPNFGGLASLWGLYLDRNQLKGQIPDFSNLPNLAVLYLDNNQLNGTIPNLNWSIFDSLLLTNNCGLIAYDAAQEATLNSQDPNWQTRNPSCPNVVTETFKLTVSSTAIITKSQMGTTPLKIAITGCNESVYWKAETQTGGYITNLLVTPAEGNGDATVTISYRKPSVMSPRQGNAKITVTAYCGNTTVVKKVNIR